MTTETAREPTLAELSDEERNERFDRIQERMRGAWEIMRRNEEGESVVVIPSVSVDRVGERSGSLQQAYEERFLVLLLLLRHPRLPPSRAGGPGSARALPSHKGVLPGW